MDRLWPEEHSRSQDEVGGYAGDSDCDEANADRVDEEDEGQNCKDDVAAEVRGGAGSSRQRNSAMLCPQGLPA